MRTPDRYNTECPKLGLKRGETMFREDMAYVEAAISNFRDGNYTRVIRDLEEGALSVIGGTAKKKGIAQALQIHCSEVLLARLYWTGKAYRASGAGLDAIACYRIVLSQSWFRERTLSQFREYYDLAAQELDELERELGAAIIGNVDPEAYLKAHASRCFVATAAMGSSGCWEVRELRRFRDETLQSTGLGRRFIQAYYAVGPQLAGFLTRWPRLAVASRPIIRLAALAAQRIHRRQRQLTESGPPRLSTQAIPARRSLGRRQGTS